MGKNDFYVYIYLDPRKPGEYIYDDLKFDYEPFYVGKGTGRRIESSMYDKLNKFKSNKIKKIKENNINPITFKIYENLTEIDSLSKEIIVIQKIGRIIKHNGPLTNFSDGGTGGDNISKHPHNKEIREKMSNSQKGGKNNFYGRKHSDETKKILSKIHKEKIGDKNPFYGKTHTEETKRKISEKNKIINIGDKNPFYGKTHTEETKRKISEKNKGLFGEKNHFYGKKHTEKYIENVLGKNNQNSVMYIIETPDKKILKIIGRKELFEKLYGLCPTKILINKEHNGYKLLEKIKINKKS